MSSEVINLSTYSSYHMKSPGVYTLEFELGSIATAHAVSPWLLNAKIQLHSAGKVWM
jgi:hypothetical protein